MNIKVNIVLVTYNHEEFIEETLESILMQQTNFNFDIIVADDRSTDSTLQIIKEVASQSNIVFRFLESPQNLGITPNYKRAFAACDAPYAAIMEGDDLWTNPFRLQIHIDFLENHYECPMTFNRYVVADANNGNYRVQPIWAPTGSYQLVTSRDIAKDNFIGNFSTCVYRTRVLHALPNELFDLTAYDWIVNIMVGTCGMIGYLAETMNIYRIHSNGVWSRKKDEDRIRNMISLIDIYDEFTGHMFSSEFHEHRSRLRARLAIPTSLSGKRDSIHNVRRCLRKVLDYMPPIILYLCKLFIPRKLWDKIGGA